MTDYEALLSKPTLRIPEAAVLLDVTPRTVQKYLEEGKLEYKRLPGGHRRVLTESVKTYGEKKQLHDSQLVS
jgi:excisionase family DNA binding protein